MAHLICSLMSGLLTHVSSSVTYIATFTRLLSQGESCRFICFEEMIFAIWRFVNLSFMVSLYFRKEEANTPHFPTSDVLRSEVFLF